MSPRSEEYVVTAEARLRTARLALAVDPGGAVSAAYYVVLNAARAALSERDLTSRTHSGLWHLFRETFGLSGAFDEELYSSAARMREQRESVDYSAVRVSADAARDAVERAEQFLSAVLAMLQREERR